MTAISKSERNRRWLATRPGYMREYQRKWRAKHPGYLGSARQCLVDRVNGIKTTTRCVDCGGMFPACCMDFDHVRGVKAQEVGALVARTAPWPAIEAEIAKCDLVCANCHRVRTATKGSSAWMRQTIEKDESPKGAC